MKIVGSFYRILASASILIATAAIAAPQPASALGGHLCLALNLSRCIVAHGIGPSATIESSGWNTWTLIQVGQDQNNNPIYTFTNNSGNCLRSTSPGDVTVKSGNCFQDATGWWAKTSNSYPDRYQNQNNGMYLGTWGDTAGNKVYARNQQQGFWSGWTLN